MTRLPMSPAATALFRGLIMRAGVPRDRILLSEWTSVDWQSLTFVGERHEIQLRICGAEAAIATARLTDGLADAEFDIGGQVLADIALTGDVVHHEDGSITLNIEALTIAGS